MLKRFLSLLSILVLIVVIFFGLKTKEYMETSINLEKPQLITIKSGAPFLRVITQLQQRNIVAKTNLKKLIRFVYPELTKLRSGTYQITPNMNLKQLLKLITTGKEYQFAITLIEGETYTQWKAKLLQQPYLKHELDKKDEAQVAKLIDAPREKLEGLLLADTYYYTYNTSDVEIISRAHKHMRLFLKQQWGQRDKISVINTPYQALILASIVEKETNLDKERPIVASVFINRLEKNMRLQTDPSVIYGMGESYNGNITKRDLRAKTLYNTYVINGLPPTPIAMPCKESLMAVLHPAYTPFYYFVANVDGGHKFSTTLKEHNVAVKQYIRDLKNR